MRWLDARADPGDLRSRWTVQAFGEYPHPVAAQFAFYVLIYLTPVLARSLSSEISGAGAAKKAFGKEIWDLLTTPDKTAAELSAEISARLGYSVVVADIVGEFELRLLQVHWQRDGNMAGGTDDAITTHHFVKLAGGAPVAWDDATDLDPITDKFVLFPFAFRDSYPLGTGISSFRWYRSGPGIAPPQPAIRTTVVAPSGHGGAAPLLPPQVAMSITEKTSDPKSWGRFYLPVGQASEWVDNFGRFTAAQLGVVGDALETLISALDAAGTPMVVYSAAKPARLKKDKTELPATTARALAITGWQIDDIADVIRTRRYDQALIRQAEAA